MSITTAPDPVLAHRVDYWTWVELHAVPPTRDTLLSLRDHWHHVNVSYFGGVMALPYITLTEPSSPRVYGQCCSVSSWGSRLEIRIRPSLLSGTHPHMGSPYEGRFRFVADVVLHEAVHQYYMEVEYEQQDAYHGHGRAFTTKANEIGARLGLSPVIARNRRGSALARAAQWPHCVRPPEYYLGAYVPPTRDTESEPCPHCHGTGRQPIESEATS